MVAFRFRNVCIEGYALNLPDLKVTSAEIEDKLSSLYARLSIPSGTLERLSGIGTRTMWTRDVAPSAAGTKAIEKLLETTGFDRDKIGALFSCSVTRDYFEPATGCLMHKNLGLKEECMALDLTNACMGFSNGLMLMSNLIDSGVIKAGIVVSAENISCTVDATMKKLLTDETIGRDQLLKMLPTFTLGCGSVAYLLVHESIATKKHRIIGATGRSASQFSDLCIGNADYGVMQDQETLDPVMETESTKLIQSAAKLGGRTWKDSSEFLGWAKEDVDHVVCHQVGRQVNEAFYREMGLDMSKEFTIYKTHGNLVSAAVPTALALAVDARGIKKGDKVVLTAFGSGLNSMFVGIEW